MLRLEHLAWQMGDTVILDAVDLTVAATEIVSLLGPSGSGKTSVLRAIMGLAVPQRGAVVLDDADLTRDGRVAVPPERRPFAFLFQSFTLFPHLDVRRNITVGIKHLDRSERRRRLDRVAALLRIDHLLTRPIHDLSGGEQQRVALARTLALEPRMLLLDEPFSNLDAMTKDELYHDVKSLIREAGIAAVLATHDQAEACYFSDRMVVMDRGRVMVDDTPRNVYERPANEWLARFTGEAHLLSGAELATLFPGEDPPPAADARYVVRPEHLAVRGDDAATNAEVRDIAYYGFHSRVALRCDDGTELTAALLGGHDLTVGDRVSLALTTPPTRIGS